MISKFLSLLSTAKGVAAATVIATAGVTGGVVATNPDLQNAIGATVQNVTQSGTNAAPSPSASPSQKASPSAQTKASTSGQPVVVAARNAADKKLRDAFQDDQRTIEKLRSTKVEGADRGKLEDTVKEADAKLRARLTKALDEVAALTLGREGDRERESDEASGSPKPNGSPKPSGSPSASASPKPSESAKPSGSPDVAVAFTADAQAKVDAIVTAAIADMATIVTDTQKAVATLPTFAPGKPSGVPGEKPSDAPRGKPSDAPGGAPSARPTVSATPTH